MRTVDINKTYASVGAGSTAAAIGGTPQPTKVSTAFAQPLSVQVKDAWGNPVQSAVITFTVPASAQSAVLSAPTAVTNGSGIASVTATANATAGGYVVTAGVPGVATPASFALTNTP
jgi:hypothetical protein